MPFRRHGDNDDCWLLTCNIWTLLVGQLLALSYVRLMFGTEHVAGQPPKYCAFNIEPRGLPVRMVQGSLYFMDYRIHHWVFYLTLTPIFVFFGWYIAIGFSTVMISHGLWYDDRFEFRYTATNAGSTYGPPAEQAVPDEHTHTFQLEEIDAARYEDPGSTRSCDDPNTEIVKSTLL